jgi:hypothetical protein
MMLMLTLKKSQRDQNVQVSELHNAMLTSAMGTNNIAELIMAKRVTAACPSPD